MWNSRIREIQKYAKYHIANKWWNRNLNPGGLILESPLLITILYTAYTLKIQRNNSKGNMPKPSDISRW